MRSSPLFLAASILLCAAVAAEDDVPMTVVDVPPPPPMETVDIEENSELEPEVTIIRRRDATHEEYRLNGRLYMVKVTPSIGPPYYYVDRDGDGLMDTRMNDIAWEVQVPKWVIFSW